MHILTYISVLLLIFTVAIGYSENKKELDKQAIKSMCGCYEVSFNFAESFYYGNDSNYTPSPEKHDSGLEWVELVEDSDNKIVMQHLLIIDKDKEPFIIKHWRQDWIYENQNFYKFDHDNRWQFVRLKAEQVKGEWTQKVFQVDDSPRYEGTSHWIHIDGKSYWENTTDAPLPRRERKRDDYNVMIRGNRHEITDYGWLHEQDNKKLIRSDENEDFILAEEKGYNYYRKVEDSKCETAKKWWSENHHLWDKVRRQWNRILSNENDISLYGKVQGQRLNHYLHELQNDPSDEQVYQILKSFVK